MINNGHKFDDMSMLDLFRMEAEKFCVQLSDDLLNLENKPGSAELLESLMRAAHSIKGAARVVNLNAAVQIAHAMEDVFVAAQKEKISLSSRQQIDHLLQGVDMLDEITRLANEDFAGWEAKNKQQVETLVTLLRSLSQPESALGIQADLPVNKKPGPLSAPAETESINIASESSPKTSSQTSLDEMSMHDLFRLEVEKFCQLLSDDLLTLEKGPASDDLLQSLMRAAHSIKGAARIVGFDGLVKISHAMEDVFVTAGKNKRSFSQEQIDLLLQTVDFLMAATKVPDETISAWQHDNEAYINSQTGKITALIDAAPTELITIPHRPVPHLTAVTAPAPVQKKISVAAVKPSQKQTSKPHAETDRDLRVSVESMNRLMGLVGEIQLESGWLPTFSIDLLRLKQKQDELHRAIDTNKHILESNFKPEQRTNAVREFTRKVEECRELMTSYLNEFEDHARRANEISHRLYREVIANRMRPFADGIRSFPRLVRDLAKELYKEVSLEIIGEDTLVDRDILDKIEAPLNHIIRNALDHGFELPEERLKNGKPRAGKLRLEARHSSGMLNIIICDDGRGIDLEKLRQKIIADNMVPGDIAKDLNESELLDFLFLPNFSTKDSISTVSGRGVGLDVVHNVVHEVRGVVRISTKLHEGTVFEMQLPLTLSVMRALLISVCDEPYAFPLVAIDYIIKIHQEAIKEIEGRQYFTFDDKRIGLVTGRQLLGKNVAADTNEYYHVVIISDRGSQYGIIVDHFIGIRHLVVQSLDQRLGKVQDISAAAILEDGSPVLIVDTEDMVRSMDSLIYGHRLHRIDQLNKSLTDKRNKKILVVDDSITVREVERKMLMAKGYEVDVAVDGMEAWNIVRTNKYDLLITDIDMPRMDGIELVQQIKDDRQINNLPVIIVSYKDRQEDRTRGLEAGADYYLTKGSFQDESLVSAVEDLIGGPVASVAEENAAREIKG